MPDKVIIICVILHTFSGGSAVKRGIKSTSDQGSNVIFHYRYPWGDEAFEKAKEENKPIFLSGELVDCSYLSDCV